MNIFKNIKKTNEELSIENARLKEEIMTLEHTITPRNLKILFRKRGKKEFSVTKIDTPDKNIYIDIDLDFLEITLKTDSETIKEKMVDSKNSKGKKI